MMIERKAIIKTIIILTLCQTLTNKYKFRSLIITEKNTKQPEYKD